ncbi:hypothetical protein MHYP_G00271040 [Metynnis hypsauchen]
MPESCLFLQMVTNLVWPRSFSTTLLDSASSSPAGPSGLHSPVWTRLALAFRAAEILHEEPADGAPARGRALTVSVRLGNSPHSPPPPPPLPPPLREAAVYVERC